MSGSTIVIITGELFPTSNKCLVLTPSYSAGANSGIGYATAQTIASQPDHHVIMASRDLAKGQEACSRLQTSTANLQGTASVLQLDVEDDASISKAVDTVRDQFGRLDVFISNAGTVSLSSTGREKIAKIFSTNVFGAMLATEAFIPLLVADPSRRPYIIQVSSGLGSLELATDAESVIGRERWDEYRMSKTALNMMTIQLHKRVKDQNVRVFAYCPGLVRSNLRGTSEGAVSAGGNAGDPMESANGILDVIRGRRDDEAGGFIHKDGSYPW